MTEHLTEVTAAAFVDGRLSRRERALAEEHLSNCAECRREITEVGALVRPRRRLPAFAVPLAAAAAVVLLVVGTNGRNGSAPEVLRSNPEVAKVQTVAPGNNQPVPAAPAFVWHHVSDAIQYRLTVTNAAGDVVTEKLTTDTTAIVQLTPAQSFQWYITATLRDGSVLSSSARTFVTQ